MVGSDLKAFRRLHLLTVAYAQRAPSSSPDPLVGDSDELGLIEQTARACGVFHRRTSDPAAIEVRLDGHVWEITPDPVGRGWLARFRDLDAYGDVAAPLWLRRTAGETAVPTIAWARLLDGEPLDRTWVEGVNG